MRGAGGREEGVGGGAGRPQIPKIRDENVGQKRELSLDQYPFMRSIRRYVNAGM